MTNSMITFRHVSYTYPEAPGPALADLTLDIDEGEFLLVIGDSGAGKSTLLRCINGLVPHFYGGRFQGDVTVDSYNTKWTEPRDLSARVGFVFQDPEAQFVVDTVEDELVFGMENFNVPPLTMRKRVEEVLDQLNIAHLRHRRISTLSGGEKQRVAIAAALTMQPHALVLDEPTSQLDPQAAEEVLAAVQRLNADLGLTVILAEHRLERVLQYADRVLYLSGPGGAAICGDPRTVMGQVPLTPPLVALGKTLGWHPLPLTIKEGRRFAQQLHELMDLRQLPFSSLSSISSIPPLAIEVENVWFSYDGHEALKGVDLSVRPGEFVALMGRNGSGKTTLAKHLLGLLRPQQGRVRICGNDVAGHEVQDIAATVGYVPQDPNSLLFADSVRDEIAFTLRARGLTPKTAPIGPEALLERLNLTPCADTYPRDLSAGQRQRAALAAILVTRPRIIVLDEPTRGLDYRAKQDLVSLLRGWQAEGATIVMITHDVELVASCADRVVLLSEGQVAVDGPARAVLSESVVFSSQINKLFRRPELLTLDDVLRRTRGEK